MRTGLPPDRSRNEREGEPDHTVRHRSRTETPRECPAPGDQAGGTERQEPEPTGAVHQIENEFREPFVICPEAAECRVGVEVS